MAESIVQGLFGLTPLQLQQQRRAQLDAAANAYGAQDPFQRASTGFYRAGGQIADIGAGMLGMQTPEMADAQRAQQIFAQSGGLETPEQIRAAASRFMNAGDNQRALLLVEYANKREKELQEMSLSKAHEKYYSLGGAKNSSSQLAAKQAIARNDAMKLGLNAGLSGQELFDFADAQVQKVTDTWNATTGLGAGDGVSGDVPIASPMDATGNIDLSTQTAISPDLKITKEQRDLMLADALQRGDTVAAEKIKSLPVTNTIPLPKSKAEVAGDVKLAETLAAKDPAIAAREAAAKTTGEDSAKANIALYAKANSALDDLQKLDRLQTMLNTGDLTTGQWAELRTGINKTIALLGGKKAASQAEDTEILEAMLGSQVFELMGSLGLGSKQMDTPAEREFMRKVLAGTIPLEKGTIKRMAEMRRADLERNVNKYNDRVDSGSLDNFFNDSGLTKKKLEINKNRRIKFDSKGNMVQ